MHGSSSNNTSNNKRLIILLGVGGCALILTWLILLSAAMNSIMSSTSSSSDDSSSTVSSSSSSTSNDNNINNNKQLHHQEQKQKDEEIHEEDIVVTEPITIETIRHLKKRITELQFLLLDSSSSSSKNQNNNVCNQIRKDLIQSLQIERELQLELNKCKASALEKANEEDDETKNHNHVKQHENDQVVAVEKDQKNHHYYDNNNDNDDKHKQDAEEVIHSQNHDHEYPAEKSGGKVIKGPGADPSKDAYGTIPILVLAYNRPKLLKNLLNRIHELLLNSNKKHGIDKLPPFRVFISQDFDGSHPEMTRQIQDAQTLSRTDLGIVYLMHNRDDSGATPQEEANGWKSYYAISKHYAWAISQTFAMNENYKRIIILEEDLELSFDFFEYMAGMSPLFDRDPTLYCVSGFNDNGKAVHVEDSAAVYRSDFFPGLGWMMARPLWEEEMRAKWPKGFWDDWMRQPVQRKGRSCLRPEISRSKPICEDGEGASQGQFCGEHLKQIVLNDPLRSRLVHWNAFNLDTLLPRNYDVYLRSELNRAKVVYNVQSIFASTQGGTMESTEVQLKYSSNDEFVVLAHALNLMDDFKDGVPRTAYHGIVTIKWREVENNGRYQGEAVMFSNKQNEENVNKIRKVHLVSDKLLYDNSAKRSK